MKQLARGIFGVTRQATSDWVEDGAFRLSAALAYYTVFSIGPLLMVSIGVAGLIYGKEAVEGEIIHQLSAMVGQPAAEAINSFLADTSNQGKNKLTTVLGIAILLFGATTVFLELKSALNAVWKVPPNQNTGVVKIFMQRLLSVAMVLSTGFLLLVSLVISAVLSAVSKYIEAVSGIPSEVFRFVDIASTLLFVSLVFALIFKYLPDTPVQWKYALSGATVTAVLFSAGKLAIGLYLGQGAFSSTYGASASVMIILIWTYYSTLILFFGAEITKTLQKRDEESSFQRTIRS